jgi:putative transcriptional regulator
MSAAPEQQPSTSILEDFAGAPQHPLDGANPWVESRLSSQLADFRIAAGLTQAQLAERAGLSMATVNRIEAGQTAPAAVTALGLCVLCGVTDEAQHAAIEELAHQFKAIKDTERQGDIPNRAFLGYEAAAARISIYAMDAVPSVLQSDSYARIIRTALGPHPEYPSDNAAKAEQIDTLRRQRAAYLLGTHAATTVRIIIDEGAIHRMSDIDTFDGLIGDLTSLAMPAENAALNPNLSIQITPFASGTLEWVRSFTIFESSDPRDKAVAFAQTVYDCDAVRPEKVAEYQGRFERAAQKRPGPEHTPEVLAVIRKDHMRMMPAASS